MKVRPGATTTASPETRPGRIVRTLACIAATIGLIVGSGVTASADEAAPVIDLTDSQETEIRAWMTDAAVPINTQDALVRDLERWILPQSSTGVEPISTQTEKVDGMERTTDIYADGSRRISSEQLPTKPTTGSSPLGNTISGCTTYHGWRVGCLVKIEDLVSSSSFRIDWYPSSSGKAQVRDMRAKACHNSLGNCSVSGSIKRATQSGTAAAWAEQKFVAWIGPIKVVTGEFGVRALGKSISMYHPF